MKQLRLEIFALSLSLIVMLVGCNNSAITRPVTPLPTTTLPLTSTATPVRTSPVTPTLKPTATPPPAPTPGTITSIFAQISASVALIETPVRIGSGLLIEDGYVVTNAHVVWPFQEVRVVFPDGSEYLNAPVLHWDLLADLALIGPLPTSITPARLVNGEELAIGSEVYLIGYPGESQPFPQPTLTRGLISRRREWESLGITYFQTDALLADGQSGGVLVSEKGDIIGISGFFFTEVRFGLVASASDLLPRIQSLIAPESVPDLGDRRLPLTEGQFADSFMLQNEWDSRIYVINEPVKTPLNITLESKNDAVLAIFDLFGNIVTFADAGVSGIVSGAATTDLAAPYFVVLGQYSAEQGDFHVRSDHSLRPYADPDDGLALTVGQTLLGGIDCPGDIDYYLIDLAASDLINIRVDSVQIDPFLIVDFPGARADEIVSDNDGGGGLFGQNAELTYKVPVSGRYFIIIGDAHRKHVGGYFLKVVPATPAASRPAP